MTKWDRFGKGMLSELLDLKTTPEARMARCSKVGRRRGAVGAGCVCVWELPRGRTRISRGGARVAGRGSAEVSRVAAGTSGPVG